MNDGLNALSKFKDSRKILNKYLKSMEWDSQNAFHRIKIWCLDSK